MCGMSRVSKRGLELLVFQNMRPRTRAPRADTYHVTRIYGRSRSRARARAQNGVRVGGGGAGSSNVAREVSAKERILEDAIKEKSAGHR